MPRTTLQIADRIEHLSILDENGKLDMDLEPAIPDDLLLKLYRYMLLGRRFDERMLDLQRQGRIGTFPPIKGQEASQLGAVSCIGPDDWLVPSFRETTAELWRGRSMESVLLYYNGYNEGTIIPAGQKDMPMAVPVGSQVLHAVGLGWAAKYRQQDEVVMTFFGDGATSEGDFHEGLNFAAVYQTPVIFICQNNHWAISVPVKRQTHSQTLAQKAIAYGMPGIQVDGNDVLAVYSATKEAVDRARKGGGPTFIECVTYRIMMHTTADDPSKYRSDEEVAAWKKKDPLIRFEQYLAAKGLLDEERRKRVGDEVMAEIQEAVESAEERMTELGDPVAMFEHLFASLPPYLATQKDELVRRLTARGEEDQHG